MPSYNESSNNEFIARARGFGMNSYEDVARNLGIDRGGAHRMWTGTRPVSERTWQRLKAAMKALPRALSAREIRVLKDGVVRPAKAGSLVFPPPARNNFERGCPWESVMADLVEIGLLRRVRDSFKLTADGRRALFFLEIVR